MARNKQHFMKGQKVTMPDGLAEDVKATRIRIGWSRSQLAKSIQDPNGVNPSSSWVKMLEEDHTIVSDGALTKRKVSLHGYRGALTFLIKKGDSDTRARWRGLYETPTEPLTYKAPIKSPQTPSDMPVSGSHSPPSWVTPARKSGDLVDRMLNAFDSLSEDDQWNICIIAEKVAKASKFETMMIEAMSDRV